MEPGSVLATRRRYIPAHHVVPISWETLSTPLDGEKIHAIAEQRLGSVVDAFVRPRSCLALPRSSDRYSDDTTL